jgi:RNA polymerase sigma-70 factor (sigma-E family)
LDVSPGFAAFVAARSTALYRTALLLTGHPESAEDLVQDALERAYRSWHRIEQLDQPEAYVRRILVNLTTDRWRRRRFTEHPLGGAQEAHVADHAPAVVVRSALLAEMARLSPRQRAVLVLRYWEELTEAETATVMDCAVGTVKATAHQAVARLRGYLAEIDSALPHEEGLRERRP